MERDTYMYLRLTAMVVLCVATLPQDSYCQDEPELKLPDPFDADSGQEEEQHGASTHDDDGLTTSNLSKHDINKCVVPHARCTSLGPHSMCTNERNNQTGEEFTCGCLPGYSTSDDSATVSGHAASEYCGNVNECHETGSLAARCDTNAVCLDSPGAYSCVCKSGFSGDGNMCSDIDECDRYPPYCGPYATCQNTEGSYVCHCSAGAEMQDGDCGDRNECAGRHRGHFCDIHARCVDLVLSYRCDGCLPGFSGNGSAGFCQRIAECATEELADCTVAQGGLFFDTEGSHGCHCLPGFQNDSPNRCVDEDECEQTYPSACSSHEQCVNTIGTFQCECKPGYAGARCNRACPIGYTMTANDTCADRDECDLGKPCGSHATCLNTRGSYVCQCAPGTHGYSRYGCIDIDECSPENRDRYCDTHSLCANTFPGYRCTCAFKYTGDGSPGNCQSECLESVQDCSTADNNTCVNIPHVGVTTCRALNACESYCNASGFHACRNIFGPDTFYCACRPGYWRPDDVCIDIDECIHYHTQCHRHSHCVNTIGSFECACNEGYQQLPWSSSIACTDTNECNDPEWNDCTNPGQGCHNTPGSYYCACRSGYHRNVTTATCDDTDECVEYGKCRPFGTCLNHPGYYECACPDGTVPPDCTDRDECSGRHRVNRMFCDEHAVCTNTPLSYECHGCRAGYTGDGTVGNCSDIDECVLRSDQGRLPCNANGHCTNTQGSYRCYCDPGFELDGDQCVDKNECIFNCWRHANCTNTFGSYTCECQPGAELSDGFPYSYCSFIDQCKVNNSDAVSNCSSQGKVCWGTGLNSYECHCELGYKPQGSGCVDINECTEQGACTPYGTCINTPGTYSCDCVAGTREFHWVARCVQRDECSNRFAPGTYCDVHGVCVDHLLSYRCNGCQSGFTGSGLPGDCFDIDECALGFHNCDFNNTGTCVNTLGDYYCECKTGFMRSQDYSLHSRTCVDWDECDAYQCSGLASCTNTYGSFHCGSCHHGYTGDGHNCTDIDECRDSAMNNCSSGHGVGENVMCFNIAGGFECRCARGYWLNPNKSSCVDIDECSAEMACEPYGSCTNTIGSYRCDCLDGAVQSGYQCVDRDECAEEARFCDEKATCVNFFPGYTCDGCWTGHSGSGRPGKCQEIDFCESRIPACSTVNGYCLNYPAYARSVCRCNEGFSRNGTLCFDRDECLPYYDHIFRCQNHSTCRNTPGSYECICSAGFTGNGTVCSDIDECDNVLVLDACRRKGLDCINTVGAYQCGCRTGFNLTHSPQEDGHVRCSDIDECITYSACQPHGACANTAGSFVCQCQPGFQLNDYSCRDRNECVDGSHDCTGKRGVCVNTPGSYACQCHPVYRSTADGGDCVLRDCRLARSACGPHRVCQMQENGTYACDCAQGTRRSGDLCIDVDECRQSPCRQNAYCVNTSPGYLCRCAHGYQGSYNTRQYTDRRLQCVDTNECTILYPACDFPRPTCRNLPGTYTCDCRPGYSKLGATSCQDIDECSDRSHDCGGREGYEKTCSNTQGSYVCVCPAGFKTGFESSACEDIDECQWDIQICDFESSRCINTWGSFECQCREGYRRTDTLNIYGCSRDPCQPLWYQEDLCNYHDPAESLVITSSPPLSAGQKQGSTETLTTGILVVIGLTGAIVVITACVVAVYLFWTRVWKRKQLMQTMVNQSAVAGQWPTTTQQPHAYQPLAEPSTFYSNDIPAYDSPHHTTSFNGQLYEDIPQTAEDAPEFQET
ncbi:fibrillin-2-like [Sycon ciliatum]|uniref:fibrillin-2-like n=1 Tax=Sycon ciliatum TaxID=27933 RepID=UPI0031F645D7